MYHSIDRWISDLSFEFQDIPEIYYQIIKLLEVSRRISYEREKLSQRFYEIVSSDSGTLIMYDFYLGDKSTELKKDIYEYSTELVSNVLGIMGWCKQHKKFLEKYDLFAILEEVKAIGYQLEPIPSKPKSEKLIL